MEFFAANMQFLRKDRGLTQAQIQAGTGVERSTWSNYERGKSFPNLQLFNEIVKFFDISADSLLNEDLANVHLTRTGGKKKNKENVHLNVHPNVHLKGKKGDNKALVNQHLIGDQTVQKLLESQQSTINALQQLNDVYSSRIKALEEEIANLKREVPGIGKPMEDQQRQTG